MVYATHSLLSLLCFIFLFVLLTNIICILSIFLIICSPQCYVSSMRQRSLFILISAASWHLEYNVQQWLFVLYVRYHSSLQQPCMFGIIILILHAGNWSSEGLRNSSSITHTAKRKSQNSKPVIWFQSSCSACNALSAQVSVSLKCILILSWAVGRT